MLHIAHIQFTFQFATLIRISLSLSLSLYFWDTRRSIICENVVQSLLNMCVLWCLLFDPHRTTCQSNLRVQLRKQANEDPSTLRWESIGIYMLPTCVVFRTPKITPFIASIQVEIPDSEVTVWRPSLCGLLGMGVLLTCYHGRYGYYLMHRGAMRQPSEGG
jgi:hypothetical protein